jgi:hypothetical protein
MATWDLAPPSEPLVLTRDQAIEIALSDPVTSPELRGLPVDAEYGSPLHFGFRGGRPDVWKVSIDVSELEWDMAYEGPGSTRIEERCTSHLTSKSQRCWRWSSSSMTRCAGVR